MTAEARMLGLELTTVRISHFSPTASFYTPPSIRPARSLCLAAFRSPSSVSRASDVASAVSLYATLWGTFRTRRWRRQPLLLQRISGARAEVQDAAPVEAHTKKEERVGDRPKGLKKQDGTIRPAVKRTARGKPADWQWADEVYSNGTVFQGRVDGANNGGVIVRMRSLRGFLPFSQICITRLAGQEGAEAAAAMVGQQLWVKVIEVNEKEGRLVVSERAAVWETAVAGVREGDIMEGTVALIKEYGAMVELKVKEGSPPLTGLIHISELSWDHVKHPSDVVAEGQHVKVKVASIDRQYMRLGLSLRDLQQDPLFETLDTLLPPELEATDNLSDEELAAAPLSGLETICDELLKEEGISKVVCGRQAVEKRVVSQSLELWLSNVPVEGGFTVLARAGRQVQEIGVSTTMSREEMKSALKRVTSRVE